MSAGGDSTELEFSMDLGAAEMRRRAEVIRTLGDDWDPSEQLRGEREAHALLYSGLDEWQRDVYEQLIRAGVLPEGIGSENAD
ncbi:hypothetical protein CDG81_10110 [Actinopolyspora erythraea]|uniref:Uncharacterized protein n=1 Tax=Actinopolyspora erythraea TaxID=414996 RepID=A0A099D619_9ACTN|nr:DUF6400 family protein [Actinopolyspora erythraea]ASU78576.1 hypothetical protein CDG81_10110 [Actinopolyspora erythraea]KGI81578.1 hypothetical protein IL38_10110 [Actinopolyspora erythraea]